MTDWLNRLIDPFGQQRSPAPAHTGGRNRPRALPQAGESFSSYARRDQSGGANLQRRLSRPTGQEVAPLRMPERRQRNQPVPTPGQAMVREIEREANRPQRPQTILDIPVSRESPVRAQGTFNREGSVRSVQLVSARGGYNLARPVADIFADVERATGAPSGYLERLAVRESSGNPNATPGTSSARGYFQIIDGTWNAYMREGSPVRGRYGIPATMAEDEVNELRGDPRVDGLIAAEIARESYDVLSNAGVSNITERHLYMGHFGGRAGLRLARDVALNRLTFGTAAQYFSRQAVQANLTSFYRPLTINGQTVRRNVVRNGRMRRETVIDYSRPYSTVEFFERHTRQFPDTPVSFGAGEMDNAPPPELPAFIRQADDAKPEPGKQLMSSREVADKESDRQRQATDNQDRRDALTGVNLDDTEGAQFSPFARAIIEEQSDQERRRSERESRTRVDVNNGRVRVRIPF